MLDEKIINSKKYFYLCKSAEIENGKAKHFELDDDNDIAVFRINDILYAVSNVCTHNHENKIYKGYVEELTVSCPLHGWTYSLENGRQTNGGSKITVYQLLEYEDSIYLLEPEPEEPRWMNF